MTEMNRTESVARRRPYWWASCCPSGDAADDRWRSSGSGRSGRDPRRGQLTQRREAPDKTTYLGKGKVNELKNSAEARDADVVIFDNDLSPAQTRNLEKGTGVKVLDRTELILDISPAGTDHEARLAVELAQLQYSLPRLKRMWTHLSRLKMGIGMRGPAKSSWKSTAGWSKSGSTICGTNSRRSAAQGATGGGRAATG